MLWVLCSYVRDSLLLSLADDEGGDSSYIHALMWLEQMRVQFIHS